MTNRNILNAIGKALKWTVIGGFGGWVIIISIYSFLTIATISFILGCFLSCMAALGICLLLLAIFNLYDLANGHTDFILFSLKDRNFELDKPKFPTKVSSPLQNPLETTLDLSTPKTAMPHTASVFNPNTGTESIENRCDENTVILSEKPKNTIGSVYN